MRFSLRLLLLAVTAFAIGFPIWYHWPYREEEIRYHHFANGQPDKSRIQARIVATWQRQWGGGKKQHGVSRVWRPSGNVRTIGHYQNGVINGPFEFYSDLYNQTGQYLDGEKHGAWLATQNGKLLKQETFDRGLLHGLVFETSDTGRTYEYSVSHGQLDWADSRSQAHPLFRKLTAGAVDDPRIAKVLRTPYPDWATADLILDETLENPTASFVKSLKVPIVIDSKIALPTRPHGASIHNLDMSAFLFQTVQLHGAALDYRYGCIWITTPADAKDWRDPTGITEVQPPEGSRLREAWNHQLENHAPACDLSTMLAVLSKHCGGEIDASLVAESNVRGSPVDLKLPSLPLRHVLGIVLYQSNCRCNLEQRMLVILPPDDA